MTRLSFLLLSLPLLACSSSSSSGGPGNASSRENFAASYCDHVTPCCTKIGKPSDGTTCRAFILGFSGNSTYDPVAGQKCLADIDAAAKDPTFCDALFGTGGSSSSSVNSSSCSSVFGGGGGSGKPGDTCTNDDDCASSSEGKVRCASQFTSSAETRKCQLIKPGKLGDSPCVATIDGNVTSYSFSSSGELVTNGFSCDKAQGLRCDSTTQKCAAIAAVGESCSGSDSCVKEAFCDFSTNKCVARKAAGEMCSGGFDECVKTAYCDAMTKLCTAKLADDTPCDTSSKCASGSCVNGKCGKSGSGSLGAAFICGG